MDMEAAVTLEVQVRPLRCLSLFLVQENLSS